MPKRPLGLDPHGGDPPPGYAAAPAPPTPPAWDLPREIEEGLSMWAEDPNPRKGGETIASATFLAVGSMLPPVV